MAETEAFSPLLELLIRFDSPRTSFRIATLRAKERGIEASNEASSKIPYRLYEQDRGTDVSTPIGLEVIDQGMLPEGESRAIPGRVSHCAQRPPPSSAQ